jgi:serine/threonine-protein kinase HipA
MHLKNFSLLTRAGKVALSPAYDLLNTTIALPDPREELALPLNGKKSNLTRNDFLRYFARERLQLNEAMLAGILNRFRQALPRWRVLLDQCFLSAEMKRRYVMLLETRAQQCLIPGDPGNKVPCRR